MATLYSNLYGPAAGQEPSSDLTQYYKGPSGPMTKGGTYVVRGTVTIDTGTTLGADDSAKLFEVPEGAKLSRIVISPSADLNSGDDFTFNLGWASASNTHASASTGLQGSAAFEMDASDLISDAAATSTGDTLLLTRVAGELSAGTLTFVAEIDV